MQCKCSLYLVYLRSLAIAVLLSKKPVCVFIESKASMDAKFTSFTNYALAYRHSVTIRMIMLYFFVANY